MRKLTFEKAVLIVFILIILISTSEITSKYLARAVNAFKEPTTSLSEGIKPSFPTMLMTADRLYREGNYKEAATEYLTQTLNTALRIEQKTYAHFRLGICQFILKNYDLAYQSFNNVITATPNDSIAYNNAAVSAYYAGDIEKAIELEKKALQLMPIVEYYYNLARMYEDSEKYELAANNYLIVAVGEQNITKVQNIDPVRVKEKVAKLLPKATAPAGSTADKVLIALPLRNNTDALVIEDNEMTLKTNEFIVKVDNQKNTKNITALYNRTKNDPYGLISELVWTVYKDGKQINKKISSNSINIEANTGGNYQVRLNIKANGKELQSIKDVSIKENNSTINDGGKGDIITKPPVAQPSKYYFNSLYEQLFESDYKVNFSNFTDKHGIVWGKDSGVRLSLNKKYVRDRESSLVVNNTSDKDAGIWINLDSLLKEANIKGKIIYINFYGRKITENAEVFVSARVKTKEMIATTRGSKPELGNQFEYKSIRVYIPEDATGITVSIKTIANEQFNIDGFTITD